MWIRGGGDRAAGGIGRSLPAAIVAGSALALTLAVGPPAADAALRFAEPAGDGPAAVCSAADPCDIEDAIEDPSVADGDVIVLGGAGNYQLSEQLTVAKEITVRGKAPGFAGARIVSSSDPAIFMITPAARLRDLTLVKTGDKGQGLLIANGTAERVVVSAPQSIACELGSADAGNAVIRSSVCSGGAGGVVARKHEVGLEFAILEGVTAHTSSAPHAILASGQNDGQIDLKASNTIALGGTIANIGAEAEAGNSARADVTMTSSSYATTAQSGAITTLTPAGSGSNLAQPAQLVAPDFGDFRQRPGSPTIDAGAVSAASGPFDFAGDARVQAGAIDIGADESIRAESLLRLDPKRLRPGRRMTVRASCAVTCSIEARARIETFSRRRGKRIIRRRFQPAEGVPGERIKLKLRIGKRRARLVKRSGKRVAVTAVATDTAGFVDSDERLYRIKRRAG